MISRLRLLACVFALLLVPQTAHALSDQPLPTLVPNGVVEDVVRVGDRIYLGGSFSHVGLPLGGGASLDASSGSPDASWPSVNGSVNAAASDGQGGFYIGGNFTLVGGVARRHLAHIDAGGQVTAWNPNADAIVHALVLYRGTVLVGGQFANVGGQARARIAALDGATGLALAGFNPGATGGYVTTLALSGSTLYVGGTFTTLGGMARNFIGAVDAATGVLSATFNPNPSSTIATLATSGSTVYAGGFFNTIGGQTRPGIVAL